MCHAKSEGLSRDAGKGKDNPSIAGHFWAGFAVRIHSRDSGRIWSVLMVVRGSYDMLMVFQNVRGDHKVDPLRPREFAKMQKNEQGLEIMFGVLLEL